MAPCFSNGRLPYLTLEAICTFSFLKRIPSCTRRLYSSAASLSRVDCEAGAVFSVGLDCEPDRLHACKGTCAAFLKSHKSSD